nr:hypothetical protein CKG001_17320 [Bdellovibrio sp. CKG001]BFD63004.1 hypothetical protein BdHM001_16850 [Bdellovibrio sp. HM001]
MAIGSGTRLFPKAGPFVLSDVFNNAGSLNCGDGNNDVSGTYAPSGDSSRKLRVRFHDGQGWQLITPDSEIRSVPYSNFATSALKLGGFSATDFVKATLLPPASCTTGQVVYFDGTSFSCVTDAGGSGVVTDITAGAGINVSGAGTKTVAVTFGATAGTVAQGNDSRILGAFQKADSLGGDLSGTLPSPTVTQIQGQPVSSAAPISTGQVLLWDSGSWKPQFVRMQDVRNSWGGQQMIPSSACTASQAMVWSSITDRFTCQSIGSLDASAISGGTFATARLGTGTANASTYLRGDGIWVTAPEDSTKLPLAGGTLTGALSVPLNGLTVGTNQLVLESGKVAIGTTTAEAKLTVSGNMATPTNQIASGASVNLALSNIHYLESVGTSNINLTNMVNGGVYTIVIADTTSRTYSFLGCNSTHFSPPNGATTAQSIYGVTTINVGGSWKCYVTWATDFQ